LANPPDHKGSIPADLLAMRLKEPAKAIFNSIRSAPGFTWEYHADLLGKQPRGGHWFGGRAILKNNGLVIEEHDGGLVIHPSLE